MTLPPGALDHLRWPQGPSCDGAGLTLYFVCLQGVLRCGVLFNNVKCYSVEGRVQRCIF